MWMVVVMTWATAIALQPAVDAATSSYPSYTASKTNVASEYSSSSSSNNNNNNNKDTRHHNTCGCMMGPIGPPGIPGVHGMHGRNGLDGRKGEKGDPGVPGMSGLAGADGRPGTEGPPGSRGKKGLPGDKGADGIMGQKGERGYTGLSGLKGSRGDTNIPKVAFSVARSMKLGPVLQDTPISFDVVFSNIGESFDVFLSHFVCHVNGTYLFTTHVLGQNNKDVYAWIMVNEKHKVPLHGDGRAGYGTGSQTIILTLSVEDHVWVQLSKDSGLLNDYTTFSGYLLFE